jgi:hypothetical protein
MAGNRGLCRRAIVGTRQVGFGVISGRAFTEHVRSSRTADIA